MFSLMSVMALLLTSNSSKVVLHKAQLSIELILFPANLSIWSRLLSWNVSARNKSKWQAVYNRISAKRKIKLCYLLSFLIIFHALPSLLHFKMIDTSPYPFHSILDILIGHCHSFTFSQSNSSGWQINPVARANTNILIIFNLICFLLSMIHHNIAKCGHLLKLLHTFWNPGV